MKIFSKLTIASALLATQTIAARAESRRNELGEAFRADSARGRPYGKEHGLATSERWGGGVRLTGMSGIGALPGVNYGIDVAAHVRRDEMFVELSLSRWKPEESHRVTEPGTKPVDLKLDLWTLRGGWASMAMPLRAWLLVEVGEMAGGDRGMSGVVSRMMSGETPTQRRWRAAGGGFGVAWPMSDQARLFGSIEIAVPFGREPLMLARRGAYEPDPFVTRTSVGLEVGWR